jgi:Ca2+-binding EF-hand superfamily protein
MLLALGAASSAIDALKSLTSSVLPSSKSGGFGQGSADPFDFSSSSTPSGNSASAPASSGFSQISPATMSALLAAQSQSSTGSTAPTSPADALKDLFLQIDANGDGQISKSEFESALGAGGTNLAQADDVFNKLDANGDGSVSLGEMSSALKGAGGKGHHHHGHVGGSGGSSSSNAATSADGANSDPLLQELAGASSTSVTNSDGSTTTSLTYADGSKVTMTSLAAKASSSSATSSYNLIEQMIQREAKALSFSAVNTPLSLSA